MQRTTGAPRVLVAALLLAIARGASAAPDSAYAEELIAKAHRLGLGRDPHWLRLGHWRKHPLTGYRSEAAGRDFFVDPHGRTDPAAELEADLRAFFGAAEQPADEIARGLMPAFCRFPARLAVLQQKLGFDPARLDVKPCPRLDEYWERVQPESVSLIFSAYYLNNPASMFGHTFLRVRKRGPAVDRQKRELLDSAIDYAADPDTSNPVLYAVKGVFGFFPGTFRLRPYFYKVREYNDYESRDLFEYDLALSDSEVALLVAHVFELGSTHFDYYYADENCSYHILAALEAAAPRLALLDHLGTPVVPIDTVKALYANPGLVRDLHYRPSAITQFNARVAGMPADQRALVEALAHDAEAPLAGLGEEERIHVLDAGADLVDVRYAKELPFDPGGEGGRIKQRLLERRAALQRPSEPLRIDPPAYLPHDTHGSARLSSGALWSDTEGAAATLGAYLALHALDDPLGGYPDLSQIEFFPLEVRVLGRDATVRLERLDFVDALSLHAMTAFDHGISWKVRGGVERIRDAGCAACLAGTLTIGSGVAAEAGPAVAFATGDVSVQFSDALRGFSFARGLRAGVGPAAGVRLRAGERLTAMVTGHLYWLPDAAGPWTWSTEAEIRLVVARDVSLGISGRKLPDGAEAGVGLFFFH